MSEKKSDYEILKKSKLFNKKYYYENNKEVKDKNIDPIKHFLEKGWKEGKNPSNLFDVNFYLNNNKDVKEAGINPLIHYIKFGKKENRKISEIEKLNMFEILKLLKKPLLIKRFFSVCKNEGIKIAFEKFINKVEKVKVNKRDENMVISLDQILSNIEKNNVEKIQQFYIKNLVDVPIDIIIPIYNGYEFLEKLFESILKNTTLPYRLIIGNDNSSDKRIAPFLEEFIAKNDRIEIIYENNQENLGFVKNVNKLVKLANNHLVILNTDTEVPKYWLERLMYPILSDNKIASTTPFTNSGTICSFPNYLENNEIYKNLKLEEIDNIFKYIDVDKTMLEIPTGIGFCMGMNFNVVKEIGVFDEIYGKGYCEENDWCQRAIQAGYKNVHVTNLFVYHKHGGSFLSEDKIRYIENNHRILLKRYPDYDGQVQKIIQDNDLKEVREFTRLLLDFIYNENGNILIIDHDLGGGANFYRDQKIKNNLKNNKKIILLEYNYHTNSYKITFFSEKIKKKYIAKNYTVLSSILEYISVEEIFVNGLVSFVNVPKILDYIIKLKNKGKTKLIYPVHDYFSISPDYTLLDEGNKYSGVPNDLKKHEQFLKKSTYEFKLLCQETDIFLWREKWGNFLKNCNEILCFSHSSEEIMLTAYPFLTQNLVYIPHDISGTFEEIYSKRKKKSEKIKIIGVLGNINLAKGSLVLKELVEYIDKNKLEIKIVLIGNIDNEIKSDNFIKTGSYKKEEVPELIQKYEIDEFLIPSIWPETFSYTTDEIMQLGYPLTVFDLGAPAERVKNYAKGRVISLDEDYLKILCNL